MGEYDFKSSPRPLVELEADFDFFKNALKAEFVRIAASYHCSLKISDAKLLDVYFFWKKDVERNSVHGFRERNRHTDEEVRMAIDHIKRSALLAFWIRRLQPIIAVNATYEASPSTSLTSDDIRLWQNRFMGFDNEICAFKVGIILSAIYENDKPVGNIIVPFDASLRSKEKEDQYRAAKRIKTKTQNYAYGAKRAADKIADWTEFRDYLMVMKYKNISPYSLYLVYRSLIT